MCRANKIYPVTLNHCQPECVLKGLCLNSYTVTETKGKHQEAFNNIPKSASFNLCESRKSRTVDLLRGRICGAVCR